MPFLSMAIALIVKSLLRKSSLRLLENFTESGCLASLYLPSILKVVISESAVLLLSLSNSVIVPCFLPKVSILYSSSLPKILSISSGVPFVAISQSFGSIPRIKSLTEPPTIYASKPLFSIVSIMDIIFLGIVFIFCALLC